MTMDQLVALGLPKLRPGLFYRVTTDSWGSVYLEIRKERKFGSKLLCRDYTGRWQKESPEETIVRLHEKMVSDESFTAERHKYWVGMAALEGDHK